MKNPYWGAKLTPLIRVFDDGFEDGIETLPLSRNIDPARFHALTANVAKGRNDQKVPEINSDYSTAIGQIITHEFLLTKKAQLYSNKRQGGFNCCNPQNNSTLANFININKNCLSIGIKSNDPCFGNSVNCLNYIRSFKSFYNCQLNSTAMLQNFHTAVIDLELIYNELSQPHLDSNGGKFNVKNFTQMKDILVGYDERSMQLPGLLIYLFFFVDFHNAIFDQLKKTRPSISNKIICLEARKLTTAAFQKVLLDYFSSVLRKFATFLYIKFTTFQLTFS